jgi:deazaflavin-dependent oxidoreductase (nitroreductase family)
VKFLIWSVAGVVGLLVLTAMLFVVGMRTKSPTVLAVIRRINRAFTNPRVLARAGQRGHEYGVISHTGRSSGRTYRTPIGAFPIEGGFLVSLPYGATTDWVRNVLAARRAELLHDGTTFTVVDPEVVPSEQVRHQLPRKEQRTQRMFAITESLRLSLPA